MVNVIEERPIFNSFILFSWSMLSSLFHELGHQLFSSYSGKLNFRFNLDFKKSVVSVPMTHIWTWSLKARINAVIAGLVFDMFLVNILYSFVNENDLLIVQGMISVSLLRMLWQFRFIHHSDGNILLKILLDNPLLLEDYKDGTLKHLDEKIVRCLTIVDHLVTMILLGCWFFPVLYYIGGKLW